MRFFFFKVDSGGVFSVSAVGLVIGVDDIRISDGTIDVDVGYFKGHCINFNRIFGFFAFAFEVVRGGGDTTTVSISLVVNSFNSLSLSHLRQQI